MAVTKKEVTKVWPQSNKIGAKLVIDIDDVEVINVTVWTKFNHAVGPTLKDGKRLQSKLQAQIDVYKEKKVNYDRPAYDAELARIQSELEV